MTASSSAVECRLADRWPEVSAKSDGLHHFDRVTVAKIEGQIRSVFDYELAVIARVLKVDVAALYPGRKTLDGSLEDLIEGRR